jgi:GTP pyrophosphokinase
MVTGNETSLPSNNVNFCIDTWLQAFVQQYSSEQLQLIKQACEHLLHVLPAEASHSLAIASILAELKLDHETVCAAILYEPLSKTKTSQDNIEQQFNSSIRQLLAGVLRLDTLRDLQKRIDTKSQNDNLRKMLVAMVDDARVVLIKLAERLQTMRKAMDYEPAQRRLIAEEVNEIYAPLANRLGVWQLKWELEDLAFCYLQPDIYTAIATAISARHIERNQFIQQAMDTLRHRLQNMDMVNFELSGRAKHIYSIYKKMQRKEVSYQEIYDASAIRVLVPEVADCYLVLSVVHDLWPQITHEFDDYISHPKANGYRSIHTAVQGSDNNNLEIQIRTFQMHEEAELGVAAHWAYKEGKSHKPKQLDKLSWLRQVLEWQKEWLNKQPLQPDAESFDEQVYVFTPSGDVIALPQGATPLDFAYTIHSQIGHRCKGAKVNGNIVPLTYKLQTGEQIEILTAKLPNPSRDWLSPHSAYIATHRARTKIQQWFKLQDYDQHVAEGHEQLAKELARFSMPVLNLDELAGKMHFNNAKELYAAIGSGSLRLSQVSAMLTQLSQQAQPKNTAINKPSRHKKASSNQHSLVNIDGMANLLTHLAGCCKPVLGDTIIGYITHGHYVSIHRKNCPNMASHQGDSRLIEVDWNSLADYRYAVDLQILAHDRPGLLRDISATLSTAKINIAALNLATSKTEVTAKINVTVEVMNNEQLETAISALKHMVVVTEVKRLH